MSDEQQRFGDGQDDYLKGAQKAAEAAKKAGAASAKSAGSAAAGEATANAAAAVTKAGVTGGKAAAEIAAGTAAGGPWGAILSAAWSLRHTLFKVLIFICLFLLFIIVGIVSLPSIVVNNLFHTDPSTVDINAPSSITASFDDVSGVVSDCIQNGYDMALAQVEQIIVQGGYDRELSMEALINNGLISADYDTCYTLAAYSASMQQRGTTKADMKAKLDAVAGQMFAVTYEVKETTKTVVPEVQEGEEPGAPETVTVQYVVCTIHPFDQSVILTAFGIDTSTQYDQFNLTYGEAITNMSNALKMTMYGSLVGRVPYFWGGKSAPGWNEAWNTPRLVTSAGSSSTGTIRPYGLDCSGFTDWVYKTALGVSLLDGSWSQWDTTYAITEAELLPGDIGFMAAPGTVPVNHVLLYAGRSADGKQMWVHCSSSAGGVALNSPTYVTQFRRRKDIDLEADFTPAPIEQGVNDG